MLGEIFFVIRKLYPLGKILAFLSFEKVCTEIIGENSTRLYIITTDVKQKRL